MVSCVAHDEARAVESLQALRVSHVNLHLFLKGQTVQILGDTPVMIPFCCIFISRMSAARSLDRFVVCKWDRCREIRLSLVILGPSHSEIGSDNPLLPTPI